MRRRSDLLRIATWQLEAGAGDRSSSRRAATETYRAGDMGGTARLAAGAWDLLADGEIATLLGTALGYSGRYEEADAIFAAGEAMAPDDATLTRPRLVHAAILSAGMGQPEAAMPAHERRAGHGDVERATLRGHARTCWRSAARSMPRSS